MRQAIRIPFADNIIRGSCPLFVCRSCRTKYGWAHQPWCDMCTLTLPTCEDCRYFSQHDNDCTHPAKKFRKEESGVEED